MTRATRRSSLLAAFCLLTSAATTYAECAWVLWMSTTIPALPDQGPGIVTAYPTMQECEAALAIEFLRQKREGWEVYSVQPRTVVASKGKGEKIIATHYTCLPDTVDPRGPKGR